MIVTKSRGYSVRMTETASIGPHRSGIILTQSSSSRLLPCRIRKRTSRDIKDTRVRTRAREGRRFIIPENAADRMEKPIFYLCTSVFLFQYFFPVFFHSPTLFHFFCSCHYILCNRISRFNAFTVANHKIVHRQVIQSKILMQFIVVAIILNAEFSSIHINIYNWF